MTALFPSAARLRVPASTSNLGPGFDCLGLALALWLEVELRLEERGPARLGELAGSARDWPRTSDNRLLAGWRRGCQLAGGADSGAVFSVRSEIPVGRGLGSSGAALVAGLLLARWRHMAPLSEETLLAAALELEGHPDNVTAALLGGLTLGVPVAGRPPLALGLELDPGLGFALAWPDKELVTSQARAVLPKHVAFEDARENPRRLALLLQGLRWARREWIEVGGEDRLHVAYRLPLIPGGSEALAAARAAGAWLATISGAGSALLAIAPREQTPAIAEAMGRAMTRAGAKAQAKAVEAVRSPARVEALDQ
jgi:homoserine kinase